MELGVDGCIQVTNGKLTSGKKHKYSIKIWCSYARDLVNPIPDPIIKSWMW